MERGASGGEQSVALVVHIVNTPKPDVREAYEASWSRFDAHGARHAAGRRSHTAWLVGDVLRVVVVWDSQENMNAFMQIAGEAIEESGMKIAGNPRWASCSTPSTRLGSRRAISLATKQGERRDERTTVRCPPVQVAGSVIGRRREVPLTLSGSRGLGSCGSVARPESRAADVPGQHSAGS